MKTGIITLNDVLNEHKQLLIKKKIINKSDSLKVKLEKLSKIQDKILNV